MNITVNGVSITLTPDQLKQLDAEVKRLQAPTKPTPEERFWEIVRSINRPFLTNEKWPDEIFFFRDNEWLFSYDKKTGYLYVRYSDVWSVFENEFSMNYSQIHSLIKIEVEKTFNCKGVTPRMLD